MILCGRTEYLLNFQKLLNEEGGGTDMNSQKDIVARLLVLDPTQKYYEPC